ncbi:autotransporter outer membrane beta-barrel domain-containing protein [Pseudomarimonas arenosa]|uniref:Autotransporter outer membrane beta-barrel domain-containing protein n=1 Tax=Pseudomarimonas arenosa TaxID=2774145 RepID=A0AAW3ZR20_9GAMM|nr:autotransporter outer membrane beta-barrel domain-containing protein [Pseudomarimonas arenosa]MBD8527544.1 autotransporter outer membrane beta-barrel domain-containing protein [Pseudomarimonas arenosa]
MRINVMWALVCLTLLATDALALTRQSRVHILENGRAVRSLAIASMKTQAFCQANPDVIISYLETISTNPATVRESAGSVDATVRVDVDAICAQGGAVLTLDYAALPGSSAQPGSDYTVFATFEVNFLSLTQFGSATASSTRTISLVNDDIEESIETIDIGLVDGLLVTDPNGFATVDRIIPDGSIIASISISDDDGLNADNVIDTLTQGLGSGADPVAQAAIVPLAENCSTATDPAILDQCAAILAAASNPVVLTQVLQAISGEELSAQITSSIDSGNSRGAQINGRIAALRGGATGISLDDVTFNLDGASLPLARMLGHTLGVADGEPDRGGLFDQRLGAFLNVTVLGGQRDRDAFEVGFDFDGYSALAGVDYRFTDDFIAGAAVGYSDLESDLEQDGGGLDSKGWSLTGYGTWLFDNQSYFDFAVGGLWNDYEQSRLVDLTLLGDGFGRSVATGSTDGDQLSLSLGFGRDFAWGEWTYSPRGSLLWSRSTIDGFTESGAGINDLIFSDQDFRSMLWTLSQSLSRVYSVASGALQPYLGLDVSRETKNNAFLISPALRVRPDQRSTPVFINESDRLFGRAELGVTYVGAHGRQWFFSYSRLLAFENVDAWAVRGGFRVEF